MDRPTGIERDDLVAVAISPDVGIGFARGHDRWWDATLEPLDVLVELAATRTAVNDGSDGDGGARD